MGKRGAFCREFGARACGAAGSLWGKVVILEEIENFVEVGTESIPFRAAEFSLRDKEITSQEY
jgi:hypothetical protein